MQHIGSSVFVGDEFGPYLVEFDAATGKVGWDQQARWPLSPGEGYLTLVIGHWHWEPAY
jgi:hypothetical protein